MPRNTFTALLPCTLPTEASAVSSFIAATLLAKVSETETIIDYVKNQDFLSTITHLADIL